MTPSRFRGRYERPGIGESRGKNDTFGDSLHDAQALCRSRLEEIDPRTEVGKFEVAFRQWRRGIGRIDFTDMLELPTAFKTPVGVMIVDEAQDCSPLDHQFIQRMAESCGAARIYVGDAYQCVYGFRGADPSLLLDLAGEGHEDTLHRSRRVPRAVHEWAAQLLPRVSYGANFQNVGEILDLADACHGSGQSLMILATCGYLLNDTIPGLREERIPFGNRWSPSNPTWNPLTAKSRLNALQAFLGIDHVGGKSHTTDRWWTPTEMWAWTDPMQVRGNLKHGVRTSELWPATEEPKLCNEPIPRDILEEWLGVKTIEFFEKADWREKLAWWQDRMLPGPRDKYEYLIGVARKHGLEEIFKRPSLTVGTIHSVKGGEARNVIVYPDLSWAALTVWLKRDTDSRDSILQQFYVAATRASERLMLCSPGLQGFKKQSVQTAGLW
jgi:hypothetical protein